MADFENRLVVILNEKLEHGKAAMAISHAMLGFGAGAVSGEEVRLNKYEDASGNVHNNISEMAIVVLKASSNKIREMRNQARDGGMKYVDFVDTMSIGTYEEEFRLTKSKKDEELTYWALILSGSKEKVSELTSKLSLYR